MPKKLNVYIGLGSMVCLSEISEKLIEKGYNFTINRGIGVWKDEDSGKMFNEEQITFTFLLFEDKSEDILALITEYLQENTLELCLAYDLTDCKAGFRDTQLVLETTTKLDVPPVIQPKLHGMRHQINPGCLRKAVPHNPANRFRCLEKPKVWDGEDLVGQQVFLECDCKCGSANHKGLGIVDYYDDNYPDTLAYRIKQEDVCLSLSWHNRECFNVTD